MTPALPTLAVVIPVLNESAALRDTLASLLNQTQPADRLLVVDGGSHDDSAAISRNLGVEVRVAKSAGRGNQIALGVSEVAEDVIVVGHADMLFPTEALESIRRYMGEHLDCPGGSLGHRFASRGWRYRAVEWFDRRRARRGDSYGDQVQFFRRRLLEGAGGFPAQPIMEDVELAARLRGLGAPAYLDCPVTVSPRRFEKRGLIRTLWQNRQFRRAYRRGGVAATRAIFERYYALGVPSPDEGER